MRILLRFSTLTCFIFIAISAVAQTDNSVVGVWKGILKDSLSSFEYTLRITKVVDGEITATGISGNQSLYCETNIKGSIKNGRLIARETEILRTNYKNKAGVCLLGLELSLGNKILTGDFSPVTNIASCLPGTAALLLAKNSDTINMGPAVQPTLTVAPPAPQKNAVDPPQKTTLELPAYQNRQVTLIKEIIIDADSANIQVFDNGIVDGDLITLTDNNKEVFSKALLSTTPLRYTLSNKETNIHLVAFIADNLGSIPPNTGLLVITANRQRWEINFSSDFVKTSSVKIILRERGKK